MSGLRFQSTERLDSGLGFEISASRTENARRNDGCELNLRQAIPQCIHVIARSPSSAGNEEQAKVPIEGPDTSPAASGPRFAVPFLSLERKFNS